MEKSLLIACVGCLLAFAGRSGERVTSQTHVLMPVRPALTRVIAKSALPLVVDIYWLRAINAIGTARTEAEHRNLNEYATVITTLDPDFSHAYRVLGLAIPFNRGREEWTHGELAISLLERGVARFPRDLPLQLLLGYSLMSFSDRYAEAAKAFVAASELPGAPPFAALLATRLYLKSDQFETALHLAQSMRDSATTDEERARFEHRISELQDERVLRQLDQLGARFREKHGRFPSGARELRADGFALPPDARFLEVRFDALGRALLPESFGRLKVFHDSGGGRDDDAPETWR